MSRLRIVSFSGGKDSTATYLWCLDKFGSDGFVAVSADTGNEHPVTLNYVRNFHSFVGAPPVVIVRADVSRYTPDISNPFLSLCVKKQRFPSTMARFCRRHLKEIPIQLYIDSIRRDRPVTVYTGLRRAESRHRYFYTRRMLDPKYDCLHYRPIIGWSADQVFRFIRSHKVEPNPLYSYGLDRVGCWPCIMAGKHEVSRLDSRTIDRIREWEGVVKRNSKRGWASFFPWSKDPHQYQPTIDDIVQWARTTHGGTQYDLFAGQRQDIPFCMSEWGVCE